MKLKNVLLTGLSFVLVAAVAVGGTFAYLTSTDSDVNVMTLGNVEIVQHEYQRADGVGHINSGAQEGDLVPFVQGQPLYPAVPTADDAYEAEQAADRCFHWGVYSPGWNGLWDDSKLANVMDKFVFVENTGKSDAYYRTLIALECPEGMTIGYSGDDEINVNINGGSRFTWDYSVGHVTIEGTRYEVWSATYNEILAPGEVSRPSLLQVVMTHNATNEDMELLGDTYDILVLSQAVQTAGFADAKTALDAGFGEFNEANVQTWFDGIELPVGDVVTNSDDLADAISSGEDAVITYTGSEDFVIDEESTISGDVTINFFATDAAFVIEEKLNVTGNLTITNAEIDTVTGDESAIVVDGGSLTLGEGAVLAVDAEMPNAGVIRVIDDSKIVLDGAEIKGCDNNGKGVLINVAEGAEMTIEDGTVISGNVITGSSSGTRYALINVFGTLTMNGGEITKNEFAHKTLISVERNGKFVINGGTIADNTFTGTGSASVIMTLMSTASVEMNDGTITGNNLGSNSNSAVFNTSSGGALVVNGGTVTNNMVGNADKFAYIKDFNSVSIASDANVSGSVYAYWDGIMKDVNDIKK